MKYKDFYSHILMENENLEAINLFHGTSEDIEKIKKEGLKMGRIGVFLTDNPQLAIEYAESDQDRTGNHNITLISVKLNSLDIDLLHADIDHVSPDLTWEESLAECDQCIYLSDISPKLIKVENIYNK